jgi:hypothetical protein
MTMLLCELLALFQTAIKTHALAFGGRRFLLCLLACFRRHILYSLEYAANDLFEASEKTCYEYCGRSRVFDSIDNDAVKVKIPTNIWKRSELMLLSPSVAFFGSHMTRASLCVFEALMVIIVLDLYGLPIDGMKRQWSRVD